MDIVLEEAAPNQLGSSRGTPFDDVLGKISEDSAYHGKQLVIGRFAVPSEKGKASYFRSRLIKRLGDTPGVNGWRFRVGGTDVEEEAEDESGNKYDATVHYDLLIAEYLPGEITLDAKAAWDARVADEAEKQRVRNAARAQKAAEQEAAGEVGELVIDEESYDLPDAAEPEPELAESGSRRGRRS
jgi:hypothetical protein